MNLNHNSRERFLRTGFSILFALFASQGNAQFTSGNITVLQAGDGTSALANTGNPIVLKEYSSAGILTYSMAVPSASAGNALVMSGSAGSEGFLSLSADNRYLVVGGYAAALPNTVALSGATASSINRGVGLIGGPGLVSYTRVATSSSFFSGNNIRGATASNKTNFWGSGASQGTDYFGSGTPVTVQNSKVNLRAIAIFNGQLYCSSQVASGTPTDIGVYAIGVGTPTTSGQAVTTVINTGTGSQPAQFYFNSAGTICYVADQRNSSSGGVQKWVQSAGSWSLAYTLPTGSTAVGATGVAANFSGANPVVYATTNESNSNRLIAIADAGAASTATTLATAGTANTVFRGLAFSPCSAPTATLASSTTSVCAGHTLSLNASVAGSAPLSYFWSGPGAFSTVNSASTSVTASVSGNFMLVTANACGADTSFISLNIDPLPSVTAASVTVCAGHPATLTAIGAGTYSWNTGSTSSTLVVAPNITTTYSVTGFSSGGCSATVTTQVVAAQSPTVISSSASVCGGGSATLSASGANSYTWSTGATGSSVTITPSSNETYTVTGSLTGCNGTGSYVSTVTILPLPQVTITGGTVTCSGIPVLLNASGAATYSWDTGAATSSVFAAPLVTTIFHVTGTAVNGCTNNAVALVSIVSGPVLTIIATPPYLCYGMNTATLTVSGAAIYQWGNHTTASTLAVTQAGTTTYTVTGAINASCSTTTQFQLQTIICEGIKSYNEEIDISIYPNPAHEYVTISAANGGKTNLAVINTLGELVYAVSKDDPDVTLDLQTFPKGIYFVKLIVNGKSSVSKLIVE